MKIENELNIGDKMYVVEETKVPVVKACKFCGGTGKVTVIGKNGKEMNIACPACSNNTATMRVMLVVREYEVMALSVIVRKSGVEIWYKNEYNESYTLNHKDYAYSVFAFKTREEAQAYADKVNEKGVF